MNVVFTTEFDISFKLCLSAEYEEAISATLDFLSILNTDYRVCVTLIQACSTRMPLDFIQQLMMEAFTYVTHFVLTLSILRVVKTFEFVSHWSLIFQCKLFTDYRLWMKNYSLIFPKYSQLVFLGRRELNIFLKAWLKRLSLRML